MGLLIPSSGTIFWMTLIFAVVFIILAKYAFPAIIGMIDERKKYIDQSLDAARAANDQLEHIKAESDRLLTQAREEQAKILKEAVSARDRIISEARARAQAEARRALDETRQQIIAEKESAINDVRRQVAVLSVDVAEKILRKDLSGEKEHLDLIDRLVDEMMINEKPKA